MTGAPGANGSAPAPTSELYFLAGLPGFPHARRFVLSDEWETKPPFVLLRSLDDPELAFLAAPPTAFFPDYLVDVDVHTAQRIDLSSHDDVMLLVLVTAAERPDGATANLLAPLVINKRTREAVQMALPQGKSLTAPLFPTRR